MNERTVTELDSSTGPLVLCVGASHEQYSAVAHHVGSAVEVLTAPDTHSAVTLLQDRAGPQAGRPTVIERGSLHVDVAEREARWKGTAMRLCAREFDLLATLAREWGRVWSFAELTEVVWQRPYIGDCDAVISAVKRLRRRIATHTTDLAISSVRGVGFRLVLHRGDSAKPPRGDVGTHN